MRPFLIGLGLLALVACSQKPAAPAIAPSETAAAPSAQPAATPPAADAWIGKWIGVEGNYLEIGAAGEAGRYKLTVQTLDGLETWEGTASGSGIDFSRNGKPASIRAGTGDETGLKWLAGKTNCLIIEKGEGFCR